MAIIETIDDLKNKRQQKKMEKLNVAINKIIETTRDNGIAFGEKVKDYAEQAPYIIEEKLKDEEILLKVKSKKRK